MNSADRTKEALTARVEALCNAIYDERTVDPHGGDGYLSTILRAVKPQDTSQVSTVKELGEAKDYNTSAQKALTIEEQTLGLVKTTQDLTTLIRDLQELWLFGGLDTLSDPADEEADRAKAVEVARMIEVLAKSGPVLGDAAQNGVNSSDTRNGEANAQEGGEVKKQGED